jgi:hypothetical protein
MIEWREAIIDNMNYTDLRLKALNENRCQNVGLSLFRLVTGLLQCYGEEKKHQNTVCS